ncbi:MAG: ribose 5-phosphate isomerase B [Planctomycetota bacterium]|nr:ribose 5-phosphate isomerase B [Planctomycetota bacterium]
MKIALAADHRGHEMKERVAALLDEQGHEVLDMGTNSSKSCDYPDTGYKAARAVADGIAERGITLCGTGIGMSIVANKVDGVRAAICHDELAAQMSRRHNSANVLCLATDILGEEMMRRIVKTWLDTEFESGGRHERRVQKIAYVERGEDPAGCAELAK